MDTILCPSCRGTLPKGTGRLHCPNCFNTFEPAVFTPVDPKTFTVPVMMPEGWSEDSGAPQMQPLRDLWLLDAEKYEFLRNWEKRKQAKVEEISRTLYTLDVPKVPMKQYRWAEGEGPDDFRMPKAPPVEETLFELPVIREVEAVTEEMASAYIRFRQADQDYKRCKDGGSFYLPSEGDGQCPKPSDFGIHGCDYYVV